MGALFALVVAATADVVGNEHITTVVITIRAWVLAAA